MTNVPTRPEDGPNFHSTHITQKMSAHFLATRGGDFYSANVTQQIIRPCITLLM